MEKILPLFPLNHVIFPYEKLNLHIFEPRYKQLINDCKENDSTFGIPVYIDKGIAGYGTEVKLVSIEKVYPDGRMDIKTKALGIFRIVSFQNPWKDKLYAGGKVEPIRWKGENTWDLKMQLLEKVKQLYNYLNIHIEIHIEHLETLSFEIAHKIGLSIEQEYHLLQTPSKKERQEYIIEHLDKAIPMVRELEKTKEIIKLNGHFKNFDPLQF